MSPQSQHLHERAGPRPPAAEGFEVIAAGTAEGLAQADERLVEWFK